ncbi:MAG: ATPase, T2SS/T4P/T4SS family [Phycisphaerales bacterium]
MPRYEIIRENADAPRGALDLEVGSKRELVLGRHPGTDLVVDDERASRRHCMIVLGDDGRLIVRDLRSQNGTKVNGASVTETTLHDGDTLTIGRTTFVVRADQPHKPGSDDAESPERERERGRGLRARQAERAEQERRRREELGEASRAHKARLVRAIAEDEPADAKSAGAARASAHSDDEIALEPETTDRDASRAGRFQSPEVQPIFDDVDEDLLRPVVPAGSRPRRAAPESPSPPASSSDGVRWDTRLEKMTLSLPPSSDELPMVVLINADGRPSAAFEGDGAGAVATRLILMCAGKARATDIHMEPREHSVVVRMRIDGAMVHIVDLPLETGGLTLRLIKTACQFKQGKRDAVLDGHFSARFDGRRIDYRASFTPTVHGSKLVVRLLDGANAPTKLSDLNLPAFMFDRVKKICEQDTGLLLVSGPTGSGKTTTLYNALREIDRERRNVITIEDPVEYYVDGVTQIPVAEDSSFGELLRSVLRQDPDVILVGEIRDQETARTAMQAAMTGHVVLSTVHAKDTIGSVFRLIDLGVEPYLVANSLDVVLAQRLVRVLCESCRREVPVTPGQATRVGKFLEGKPTVFTATGCAKCLRTGYFGRRGIYEMLDFKNNDALRDLILTTPSIQGMKRIIEQGVFQTLQQVGWSLAARGITSLEEIERVTG